MPSQMSVLKAFGLNGFLTLFYQKYWRITINVVRKCSHKSQCNAGVSKKKKVPELVSVIEASMVVKIAIWIVGSHNFTISPHQNI